jgi:hypothetical protein
MINTSEQMGGAIGIAGLLALELGVYYDEVFGRLSAAGVDPTAEQVQKVHDFIVEAEERGINNVPQEGVVSKVFDDLMQSHIHAFEVMFASTAGIALVGAIACFVLVRRESRELEGPVFGRRSRWVYLNQGRSGAITRRPPDVT